MTSISCSFRTKTALQQYMRNTDGVGTYDEALRRLLGLDVHHAMVLAAPGGQSSSSSGDEFEEENMPLFSLSWHEEHPKASAYFLGLPEEALRWLRDRMEVGVSGCCVLP